MAPRGRADGPPLSGLEGPALRSFFAIARAWKLTEEEQMQLLGIRSQSTLREWRMGDLSRLHSGTLDRISHLLGIFKALNILLPDQVRADTWVRRPNHHPLFGGRSALDRMMVGRLRDLQVVRRYLDAQRS